MPKLFTTAQFLVADRYDAWTQINGQFGIGSDPPEDVAAYRAELRVLLSEPLSALIYEAQNCLVYRLAPQIRRMEWGQYWLYREIGPGAWMEIGGREIKTGPGDLVIAEADSPFKTLALQDYRHQVWLMPRSTLDPHLPILQRPLAVHIPASQAINAFIQAYLDQLERQFEDLADPVVGVAADHLARLLALACGAEAKSHVDAVRTAKLVEARRYVERNLTAHDLGPESAAAALSISVRQLHLCFEPAGESFSQYVRRRRLQECRTTLENPAAAGRSVTDIAFSWGFSSLPTFYRAFGQAFGLAPGDVRQRALEALLREG